MLAQAPRFRGSARAQTVLVRFAHCGTARGHNPRNLSTPYDGSNIHQLFNKCNNIKIGFLIFYKSKSKKTSSDIILRSAPSLINCSARFILLLLPSFNFIEYALFPRTK